MLHGCPTAAEIFSVLSGKKSKALDVVSNRIHPFMAKVFSVQPFTDRILYIKALRLAGFRVKSCNKLIKRAL